jgi:AraC-like DNA-binding protein
VTAADRIIRWSTTLPVVGVAAVAAVVSYEHASALVRRTHGESGWTGRLIPLTVDGPSQFSREYRRLFGAPPSRDAVRIRAGGSPAAALP